MSLGKLLRGLESKADTDAILQDQLRAVETIDGIDMELSSAESELSDALEALTEAHKEIARLEPVLEELKAKLDAAFDTWGNLSHQLFAAGVDEQYHPENMLSEYAQHNYV